LHEEVNRESIAFIFKAGRVTTELLEKAMQMYLNRNKTGPGQEKEEKRTPGKISMKKLDEESGGKMSNIEITKKNIGDFDPFAREFKVRYALRKAKDGRFYVFFQSGSADAMTAAFTKFTEKMTRKQTRPSMLDNLRKMVEKVKNTPAKTKNKRQEQEI